MPYKQVGSEPFFRRYALFLLGFVVLSFLGKAVLDTADLPPLTPLHHVHALTMGAWFVLFAIQPVLAGRGKLGLHRTLGTLSPLLVLVFLATAVAMSRLNWARVGDPLVPTANGINLLMFITLYVAAVAWRRHALAHKRLMLYATLSLMGPAAGRIPEILDVSVFLAAPIVLALQVAPVVHDRLVHGRVHPATWVGFGLVLAAIPLILGLSGSAGWAGVLEALLGTRGAQSG
ncbi:hypothetical protein [Arenimonas aestuarii]